MRIKTTDSELPYLNIMFTRHCSQTRCGELFSRRAHVTQEDYTRILSAAYVKGIRSFRSNKVVVTVINPIGLQVSILCQVIKERINIISIKHHWKPWKTQRIDFIKERNRINLFNFDFNLLSRSQAEKETRRIATIL